MEDQTTWSEQASHLAQIVTEGNPLGHLAVDEATGEILAAEVTGNDKKDGQLLEPLLGQIKGDLEQVSADGAYDQRDCYEALTAKNIKAAIPPRKNAKVWQHGNTQAPP